MSDLNNIFHDYTSIWKKPTWFVVYYYRKLWEIYINMYGVQREEEVIELLFNGVISNINDGSNFNTNNNQSKKK